MGNIESEASVTALERDETQGKAVARRPYQPPRILSGEAFERVQLVSGCNFADPLDGCDPLC